MPFASLDAGVPASNRRSAAPVAILTRIYLMTALTPSIIRLCECWSRLGQRPSDKAFYVSRASLACSKCAQLTTSVLLSTFAMCGCAKGRVAARGCVHTVYTAQMSSCDHIAHRCVTKLAPRTKSAARLGASKLSAPSSGGWHSASVGSVQGPSCH